MKIILWRWPKLLKVETNMDLLGRDWQSCRVRILMKILPKFFKMNTLSISYDLYFVNNVRNWLSLLSFGNSKVSSLATFLMHSVHNSMRRLMCNMLLIQLTLDSEKSRWNGCQNLKFLRRNSSPHIFETAWIQFGIVVHRLTTNKCLHCDCHVK